MAIEETPARITATIPWQELALNSDGLKKAFDEGVGKLVAAWNYGEQKDTYLRQGKSDGSYEVTKARYRADRARDMAATIGSTLDMVAPHPTHGWISLMIDQSRAELGLLPDGTLRD